ncbi:MAG TPA: hypothetical protein PLU50_11930, partial [Pseudobdellovibrionaceae bacterium]|nr:hypothetical protein [Pseudobdellovibrionaceae bacterium]
MAIELHHPELIKLRPIYRKLSRLYGLASLLHWDQETHLPVAGMKERAETLADIYSLINETLTGEELYKQLTGLVDIRTLEVRDQSLSSVEKRFVVQCARQYHFSTCVDSDFIIRYEKQRVFAQASWTRARREDRFELFAEDLERNIAFAREYARKINPDRSAYDVLLDMHMEGVTSKWLDQIFAELAIELKKIMTEWNHQHRAETPVSPPLFPENRIESFCQMLIAKLGLGPDTAILSQSTHPFCAPIHPTDIRLTNRYDDPSYLNAIAGAIHEFGHGLHAHQAADDWLGSPLGFCFDPAICESQSRFWEIMIGKDQNFLTWLHTQLSGHLGAEAPSFADFIRESKTISIGLIRVNEGEV